MPISKHMQNTYVSYCCLMWQYVANVHVTSAEVNKNYASVPLLASLCPYIL